MEPRKAIKRHEAIQSISREHHHALLLCWKIRTGIKKNIEAERIEKYCHWFASVYIHPHFTEEETELFPVLGSSHPEIAKALEQHASLQALFKADRMDYAVLTALADQLDEHVRFEERVLFPLIEQSEKFPEYVEKFGHKYEERFQENTEDTFWLNK